MTTEEKFDSVSGPSHVRNQNTFLEEIKTPATLNTVCKFIVLAEDGYSTSKTDRTNEETRRQILTSLQSLQHPATSQIAERKGSLRKIHIKPSI